MRHCSLRLKCDGTRAETRFRLPAKRTSPFKSAPGEGGGGAVRSTTGSRGVRISGSNAAYTMFRRSVKGTGYPLHSPVSPSLPLLCVTVCHHISTGLYLPARRDCWIRIRHGHWCLDHSTKDKVLSSFTGGNPYSKRADPRAHHSLLSLYKCITFLCGNILPLTR
jgi:hypothetical protein